jgi:pyruvate ferredoxin oxidoreductase beta subunit/2-oxoisovalerate ferredoxin oxidoreductase beta subunit
MQRKFDLTREMMVQDELVHPGMSHCQGCGSALAIKLALKALGKRTVIVTPACCFCVFVGGYPYSSVEVPIVQCPFETAAVVASGVSAALDVRGEKDTVVMVWAGDGGTFDIGMQSLSGAAERNENILFVCYDNEAYMNTGIQRSSATPVGAWTTTTPEGSIKEENKKDIEKIMLAHHVPYLATASPAYPDDLVAKFKKVRHIHGTKFIHILSACPPGWRIDPSQAVRATRMATQAKIFPIYEVRRWAFSRETGRPEERWQHTINVWPEPEIPVRDYIKSQGRFKHMTEDMIEAAQENVDRRWDELVKSAAGGPTS